MEHQNKFFIMGIILLIILSINLVSAENCTSVIAKDNNDDNIQDISYDTLNNDFTEETISLNENNNSNVLKNQENNNINSEALSDDKVDAILKFEDEDILYGSTFTISLSEKYSGNPIKNVEVKVIFYESNSIYHTDYYFTNNYGQIFANTYGNIGYHKITIDLVNSNYNSDSINANLKIITDAPEVIVKNIKTYSNSYFSLKAKITDSFNRYVNEGTVTFKINGKSYKVNVKNGIAYKKLKLKKGNYKYTATFSSKNYDKDSDSAKVIVKKAKVNKNKNSKVKKHKSYYKVKIGKYSVKVPYKDYEKIKKAKNDGYFSKKYYTGQKIRYNVYTNKKVTLTKKKLIKDSWLTGSNTYANGFITPYGYKYVGTSSKKVGTHWKTYCVYKKTTYKKVLVKQPKTKVYIVIDSAYGRTSASLYHLQTKYDGLMEWYSGNYKSVF